MTAILAISSSLRAASVSRIATRSSWRAALAFGNSSLHSLDVVVDALSKQFDLSVKHVVPLGGLLQLG
ncbi:MULTISPECIES: hypothetical protein [unclassified Variovorax]|uniref:hypothetical protein n=1 Tax=unclassified Variovorax TaxID=663243 RepID=UPI00336594CA